MFERGRRLSSPHKGIDGTSGRERETLDALSSKPRDGGKDGDHGEENEWATSQGCEANRKRAAQGRGKDPERAKGNAWLLWTEMSIDLHSHR